MKSRCRVAILKRLDCPPFENTRSKDQTETFLSIVPTTRDTVTETRCGNRCDRQVCSLNDKKKDCPSSETTRCKEQTDITLQSPATGEAETEATSVRCERHVYNIRYNDLDCPPFEATSCK